MTRMRIATTDRTARRPGGDVLVRIVAISSSAGLAGGLLHWHGGAEAVGQPVWLVAALVYAISIGSTAGFIFAFMPRLGPFMELAAVSRLLLAGVSAGIPSLAVVLTTSPLLNATLVVAGAGLLRALTTRRRPMPARATRRGL